MSMKNAEIMAESFDSDSSSSGEHYFIWIDVSMYMQGNV